MQEKVLAYLNVLQESMDVINNYRYGSVEYDEQWTKVFDKRTEILKTFVEDYGLKMGSAKDQATLDELVANGTSAAQSRNEKETIEKLVSSLKFEKKKEDYGDYYTYTAVGENTSDLSFENVSIVVGLYDADGVKTEGYASANLWEAGEKVKFEVVAQQVDAKEIKATVQYYDVVD
ncbi:putative secreted protein [Bifidobacterium cuniculi]|uniref:Putative secreted protein n=2 Tax=Bifidobacterium cuniculi TaxID=1688 RepID=A0A087B578_9BIFI|nr:putative secreted protein [Bifidobacterium cuniculi]